MKKWLACAAAVLILNACGPKPEAGATPSPAAPPATPAASPETASGGARTVTMQVTPDGFVPAEVSLQQGVPVRLLITRKTDKTCAKEIMSPDAGLPKTNLPLDQEVSVDFTPAKTGDLKFGCGMDMMISGTFHVTAEGAPPSP